MCGSDTSSSYFWSSLLELDDELAVKFLKDKEVWKAAKTWNDAFVDDPLLNYLYGHGRKTPNGPGASKVLMASVLLAWIRRKITITVNGGASLVVATPASSSVGPGRPKDRLLDWMVTVLFKLSGKFRNEEQLKRANEVRDKVGKVIREKIGDRAKDMIYVDLVCTEPASQGKGYASALLDTITRVADILGDACWLESSNIANEGFYNSHGFVTVGEAIVGDDNPKWDGKPIAVQIMVRERRA